MKKDFHQWILTTILNFVKNIFFVGKNSQISSFSYFSFFFVRFLCLYYFRKITTIHKLSTISNSKKIDLWFSVTPTEKNVWPNIDSFHSKSVCIYQIKNANLSFKRWLSRPLNIVSTSGKNWFRIFEKYFSKFPKPILSISYFIWI